MSPTAVNWVYIAAPVLMAAGARVANSLAKRKGRPRVCMWFGLGGAVAMAMLGTLNTLRPGLPDLEAGVVAYIALYFMTCLQHCCRPIKKSILMDWSEKRHRGGWNAVDSITRFGWSGSAVVGGFIVDAYSYEVCFATTSVVLFAAALLWPLLFRIVPAATAGQATEQAIMPNRSTSATIRGGSASSGRSARR